MQPLAFRIRPEKFSDIIGQDHLVGKNGVITRMIEQNKLCSLILYGPPGVGKTSIANVILSHYGLNSYVFNASTDSKAKLKDIADGAIYYETSIVLIDEIHRMKKDIQDYLLPFLESGKIIIIGLTTENPYSAINPAIRSRCHIYRLNNITREDLLILLHKTIESNAELKQLDIKSDVLEYIIQASSLEIRTSLNMLEIVSLMNKEEINVKNVSEIIGKKNLSLDQNGNNYYNILSAMIKSIRGSDPNAALHYLARLIMLGDIEIITRRLQISAYEDIGLANPQIGPRVYAACQAAKEVGLPEARIPLANIVVDLALSPKSNSCYLAIDKALEDLDKMSDLSIPPHILNSELKSGKYKYLYPHDYEGGYVIQQYMPDAIKNHTYYEPKTTGSYERALKDRLNYLESLNVKK